MHEDANPHVKQQSYNRIRLALVLPGQARLLVLGAEDPVKPTQALRYENPLLHRNSRP